MTTTLTPRADRSATNLSVVARTARTGQLVAVGVAMTTLPWLVWGSAIAQAHGLIDWRLPQGIALWVLAPSIAAVTALIGGRPALRDLGRRLVAWRVPPATYLLALAVPAGIAAAAVALAAAAGHQPRPGVLMSLPAALAYLGYGIGLYLLTEEAGWRGLLLPRLQARMRPVPANLLLGVTWSVWHYPLLHVPGESDSGLPFVGFLLLTTSTTILIGALVNAAAGSVLVAALFHAAFNATYSYSGVVGPDHTPLWTAAAASALLAAVVCAATRGRLYLR
ncbi:CPBP family intramembrane glutamic endopeptidase [Micromonospora narathiwatensis]|uniref:CAAX protease self-immunity n=1 Tax=Micromonospora narathiwatensis TaxID=299146 RepID=A0A1A8ZRX6_9ACTN|nr:type II CAAX endopeptidase family protein [Micromonospora narathiwatensis]SBT46584.1 CAAX protease self-immunity [Micromonospora narathiwatensis]